jgi:phosphoribosyl 1,2-cyclic phosphodiesterase
MKLTFWGTRGSIAVPGPDTLRFGGNTTCAELRLDGGELVVIDAGTGIRALGQKLVEAGLSDPIHLLITHLHWDHVNGFPFFSPVQQKTTLIRIGGWPNGFERITKLFDPASSDGRFPIRFDQVPATIVRDDSLSPPHFTIGQTRVHTQALNHPQGCVAYRFDGKNGSLAFMTDSELDPSAKITPEMLAVFCKGAHTLVHDAQYLPREMHGRKGWGHSDWRSSLELARMAGVKRLILTHHDPGRSDSQIDEIVGQARYAAGTNLQVEAAYEGLSLKV